jgi:hypothetical protein
MSLGAQTMKTEPDTHSAPLKISPEAQKMKTRPEAVGTAENESGACKTRKRNPTHTVLLKMSQGAQNMKT